jgi:hypothetical protein
MGLLLFMPLQYICFPTLDSNRLYFKHGTRVRRVVNYCNKSIAILKIFPLASVCTLLPHELISPWRLWCSGPLHCVVLQVGTKVSEKRWQPPTVGLHDYTAPSVTTHMTTRHPASHPTWLHGTQRHNPHDYTAPSVTIRMTTRHPASQPTWLHGTQRHNPHDYTAPSVTTHMTTVGVITAVTASGL